MRYHRTQKIASAAQIFFPYFQKTCKNY